MAGTPPSVALPSILQLTAVDNQTGPGRSAWYLREHLARRGCRVSMVVGSKKSSDPKVREIWDRPFNSLLSRWAGRNVRRTIHRKLWPWLANDIAWLPGRHLARWPEFREADVVHAHTLHSGFFNLKALPGLSARKPFLWTLRDMWAVTGYAVHVWDCSHWRLGGCDCQLPTTLAPLRWNNTRHLWRLKESIYRRSRLTLVTPSRWLRDKVAQGMLAGQPVRVIPNGVDTAVFRPRDKARLRARLGLPLDRTVVLFVGRRGSRETWKGWSFACSVAERFAEDQRTSFLAVGARGAARSPFEERPYVGEAEAMADIYAACDLLLYPSLADNYPHVVAEALASGLPVLTFEVGGVPEMVVDGETGWVVPYRDAEALSARMSTFLALRQEARETMAERARQEALRSFRLEAMVDAYLDLYKEVIADRGDPTNTR